MVYIALLSAAILIGIDQIIKVWAIDYLAGVGSIVAIPSLLDLTYVENYGAAYGIMSGRTGLLVILTSAIIIGMLSLLLSNKVEHKLAVVSLALIVAGGAGNLIDRVTRGFVVDYLDVNRWITFPVFNFADCCVVIGSGILIFYALFIENKEQKKLAVKKVEVQETTISTETVEVIDVLKEETSEIVEPKEQEEQ